MILSVSRRTDIPRFYFDWFLNRLKEGFVLVRNPMNFNQVSHIELSTETIECIVFWSKNPAPMLDRLNELEPYPFYIQFTINPYNRDIEHNLPPKTQLIDTFKRLSDKIGTKRIVWRYSPVLLSSTYTMNYHIDYFRMFCEQLKGYTQKCNLSFIDMYPKIQKKMEALGIMEPNFEQKNYLSQKFKEVASENNIALGACGNLDLAAAKIDKSHCIDAKLITKIIGKEFRQTKDPNQRKDCYCMPSIDIGTYDTCLNGCVYCYANSTISKAKKNLSDHDITSPLLCGKLAHADKVNVRKIEKIKIQKDLFS